MRFIEGKVINRYACHGRPVFFMSNEKFINRVINTKWLDTNFLKVTNLQLGGQGRDQASPLLFLKLNVESLWIKASLSRCCTIWQAAKILSKRLTRMGKRWLTLATQEIGARPRFISLNTVTGNPFNRSWR